MISWIDGYASRCGPLADAARAFALQLGVGADPPRGAPGLLALCRAITRECEAPAAEERQRRFIELAGAYFALVLCDALGEAEHATQGGRHGLRLGRGGFFDPFTAVEQVMESPDPVNVALRREIALAEAMVQGMPTAPAARDTTGWGAVQERILPRLVGPQFISHLSSEGAAAQLCTYPLLQVRLAFILRGDGAARYVCKNELVGWNETIDGLHRTALVNLARCSGSARLLRLQGEQGPLVVARTGDGLDSSRLLLPGLHDVLAPELGTPFAAAVPHRDALFACAAGSLMVEQMRARAALEAERARHAITPALFVVGPNGHVLPMG